MINVERKEDLEIFVSDTIAQIERIDSQLKELKFTLDNISEQQTRLDSLLEQIIGAVNGNI